MPLILESPDGRQRLELSIVGYQFPDPWHPDYSSRPGLVLHRVTPHDTDWNWLRIHIAVRNADIAWSAEDTALLTWEVEWLADWLEALAQGRTVKATRDFLEPCLAFRAAPLPNGDAQLRVYFGYELYPPGRLGPVADLSDVFLEFNLTSEQLRAASRILRAELSRYPARTASPTERP
ncbi:MAG TPA: hypothetical protein VK066_28130 [Chloroflexota bacterium]|nr:hypothetical protein [Chloroflexota bacterium]